MNLQRISYWTLQIIAWFGIAYILLLINKSNGVLVNGAGLVLLLVFAVLGIFLSHAQRFVYLKFNILNGKAALVLFFIAISCFVTAFLFQSIYESIGFVLLPTKNEFTWRLFFGQWIVMSSLFGTWSLIYFVNHYFRKIRISEIENIKLSAQKQSVELALMRSQLNPHFLFNSLNSLKALISENPEFAKIGITKLSNILRNILIYSKRPLVSVDEEMQFVRDYLDLEKIRFEERLSYSELLDDKLMNFQIPPMTIQSLVENAVKHGIGRLRAGGHIEIQIQKLPADIEISVSNDGKIYETGDTRVGLKNTTSRLESVFGEKVSLSLKEENNKVIAKIIIRK